MRKIVLKMEGWIYRGDDFKQGITYVPHNILSVN